jgi:hypothetical protein
MKFNDRAQTLNMNKTIPSTVTIHFVDGTTQCFGFEARKMDPLTSASMEKLLTRPELQIHLSDRVLVIPRQSIKFLPVPDLPPMLHEFVIRNAQPLSAS